MSLPVRLSVGLLSIYGGGSTQGMLSLQPNPKFQFGTVNQMNAQYCSVSVGQSVMYNIEDIIDTVFYVDTPYYIVPENKVISTEDPVITPP